MLLILLIILFLINPKITYAIPGVIRCNSRADVLVQDMWCSGRLIDESIGLWQPYCSYGYAYIFSAPCNAAIVPGDTSHCYSITATYPDPTGCSASSEPVYEGEIGSACSFSKASSTCGYCTSVDGTNGVCGSANGGTYEIYPTSNLCSAGTAVAIDSAGTDGVFNWNCNGSAGSCGGDNGSTANCLAYRDNEPTLLSLELKTYDGDTVEVETGDRNQICQPIFKQDTVNPSGIQFIVTGSDVQGTSDIGTMQIRLRNTTNTYTFDPVASVDGVATIPVDLSASGVTNGTYNIEVLINDATSGVTASWIDTNRDFKYWDCKVSVSGGLYDGSLGEICPNFSSTLVAGVNFTSLSFTSPLTGLSSNMTINGDSTYISSSDSLIWGTSGYKAILNNGLNMSDLSLRLIDSGVGTTSCSSTLNFDLDADLVDPYATDPSLIADFSGMVSQDSWFQTVNGGVLSKSTITNYVSLTCDLLDGCTPGMSIDGLVAAPTINSTTGISYSYPNDWHVSKNISSKINYFEKYKKISGIGTTLIEGDLNDSNVINNTDGLLMVNGNVVISQNKINDWVLNSNYFFMIVASGDITIDPSVNNFDGILAGNNINIGGTSTDQLNIRGSLYGTNNVNITRSYTDKINNNDSPAVVVSFRPSYIFNMPSSMVKSVVDWKWGN